MRHGGLRSSALACRARAGLCMSQDGKNWARLEAEHHTAAVLDAGDEGEWDEAFIGSPQVSFLFARQDLDHLLCGGF